VPFFVRWPAKVKAGSRSDELVGNIDLAPTLFEACSVQTPSVYKIDGVSIMPLLAGGTSAVRESLLLEIAYTRAVVSKGWKYIALRFPKHVQRKIDSGELVRPAIDGSKEVRYNSDKMFPGYFDRDQLYNLTEDPLEQRNLAGDPQYKAKLDEMKQRLREHLKPLPHSFGEFKPA
jgi:arylsulfatase A-like enzyme